MAKSRAALWLLLMACSLAPAGCDEGTDYVNAGLEARSHARSVVGDMNVDSANRLVTQFIATQNRPPASIEELTQSVGPLPEPPAGKHWVLDPGGNSLHLE